MRVVLIRTQKILRGMSCNFGVERVKQIIIIIINSIIVIIIYNERFDMYF